jgi:hypothetical protein
MEDFAALRRFRTSHTCAPTATNLCSFEFKVASSALVWITQPYLRRSRNLLSACAMPTKSRRCFSLVKDCPIPTSLSSHKAVLTMVPARRAGSFHFGNVSESVIQMRIRNSNRWLLRRYRLAQQSPAGAVKRRQSFQKAHTHKSIGRSLMSRSLFPSTRVHSIS